MHFLSHVKCFFQKSRASWMRWLQSTQSTTQASWLKLSTSMTSLRRPLWSNTTSSRLKSLDKRPNNNLKTSISGKMTLSLIVLATSTLCASGLEKSRLCRLRSKALKKFSKTKSNLLSPPSTTKSRLHGLLLNQKSLRSNTRVTETSFKRSCTTPRSLWT